MSAQRIGFVLWLALIALTAMGLSALGSLIPSKANASVPPACEQYSHDEATFDACLTGAHSTEEELMELLELPTSQPTSSPNQEREPSALIYIDKRGIGIDVESSTKQDYIHITLSPCTLFQIMFMIFWVWVMMAVVSRIRRHIDRRSAQIHDDFISYTPDPTHITIAPTFINENRPGFNNNPTMLVRSTNINDQEQSFEDNSY